MGDKKSPAVLSAIMEECAMGIHTQALREIIPDPSRLLLGADIPESYGSDALQRRRGTAQALVFPLTTQEVSAVLRHCHRHRIPVTPRGAGTNLVGSTVPVQGGVILDLSRMNRVLELDENTMTITVEPGMLLQDLQAYVEARGLFYPPDPGEKASSIGGNISTNAGGMRAVKYGVTRDYVRGLEAVLADGTVLTLGGKQVKDASGLPLRQLLIGSEGTLAVITKCLLRLLPKPEAACSVLVPYPDLETGIQSVLAILRADANPTAVEFLERKVVALGEQFSGVRYPRPDAGSYILLTFDGHRSEVEANTARVRKLALENGAMEYITLHDPAQAADVWKLRGALVKAVEAFSEQEPVDIVVPISRTAEFIRFVHRQEASSGMRMVGFGHAGDGNVHLCVLRDGRQQECWERELHANMDAIYAEAYRLGGVASGEHGIGLAKRRYFLHQTPPETLAAMNAIKTALDPLHILNDQKSYVTGGTNHAETL